MRLATPDEMRRVEKHAMEEWQVPGLVLMENAARLIALKTREMLAGCGGRLVLLLAGPGSNGGDAFACARHLLGMGASIRVASLVRVHVLKGDAAANAGMLQRIGVRIQEADDLRDGRETAALFSGVDVIVDGLYGTGLSRTVGRTAAEWIAHVNACGARVLSIDLPSGIDGLTGQLLGTAVQADETVTMGMAKPGLFQYPGRAHAGRVTVADLGIPMVLASREPGSCRLIDREEVLSLLPERPADLHKGSAGRICVFAGSAGMAGAAVLCAAAAYRSGAGYVNMVLPESIRDAVTIQLPEAVLTLRGEEWGEGVFSSAEASLRRADVVLAGPGIGRLGDVRGFLMTLFQHAKRPLVLDADALRILASDPALLSMLPPKTVLTPHPMEMSALCGLSVEAVQADRLGIVRAFAAKTGAVLVLKGAGTVVGMPDGTTWINATGNPGMATAGSGDALAGIIAAFQAAGAPPESAALAGVWLHGSAGDVAAEAGGSTGLMASDLVNAIREARRRLEQPLE